MPESPHLPSLVIFLQSGYMTFTQLVLARIWPNQIFVEEGPDRRTLLQLVLGPKDK
jgi:hypothetical protein